MPESVDGRRMNRRQAAMPNRDLSVGCYRVSAIGLVVAGHWLAASVVNRLLKAARVQRPLAWPTAP